MKTTAQAVRTALKDDALSLGTPSDRSRKLLDVAGVFPDDERGEILDTAFKEAQNIENTEDRINRMRDLHNAVQDLESRTKTQD